LFLGAQVTASGGHRRPATEYLLTKGGGPEQVPKQQDAIRQMRELRAQGLAYRAIAARMEAKGHNRSHMTVHKILRRVAT
jgi:hypothetical protein